MDAPHANRPFNLMLFGPLAILGAAVGYGLGKVLKGHGVKFSTLDWSDGLALALAASLSGMGLVIILMSLSRKAAGRMVDPAGDRPASAGQISFYRQQAIVLILAGVVLAIPVLADLAPTPPSEPVRLGLMAAIVSLFAVQTLFNLRVWRRADEFVRRLTAETSHVCFWLLQGALFLWAAGEKLQLLPPISAWDSVAVLMSVYLAASLFISVRRGAA